MTRLRGLPAGLLLLGALLLAALPAEAQTSLGGYVYSTPGITGSTAANYAYASLFNPSGSGKTVVIQRIEIRGDATGSAAATYMNLTRINASSGGTLVAASQVPKKITTAPDPVVEVRYGGPSVTLSAGPGNNSRIAAVLSPSKAKDITGYKEMRFETDEKLVLQPGEGVAFLQEAAGSNRFVIRFMAEWTEEASAPAARNEFMLATPLVAGTTTVNYAYAALFNPSGSGKTLIIKRMDIRATSTANSLQSVVPLNLSRINASSGGSLIQTDTIPKKNTNSPTSVAQVRYAGPTVTLSTGPGNDSRLVALITPGQSGTTDAFLDIRFRNDEKLVLQPGEGVALLQEGAGNTFMSVEVMLEWEEEPTAPAPQNEFMLSSPIVSGSTAANYAYASLFNPSGSGKTMIVKRLGLRVESSNTAAYVPFNLTRINASSGANIVSGWTIPRKNTNSPVSVAELRYGGPAVTIAGGAGSDARFLSVLGPAEKGPGKVGERVGILDLRFGDDEKLVLQPGEGVALVQEAAGNANYRVSLMAEWEEEAVAPASQGEFMYASFDTGSATPNYAFASLFNPLGSGKTLIVKRMEIRVDAINNAAYVTFNISRTTAATGGTLVTGTTNLAALKKNTNTAATVAEIRHGGVTVTITGGGGSTSRLDAVTSPGNAAELTGEKEVRFNGTIYDGGDERIVLQPGEGIALMQEAAGSVNHYVRLMLEWQETSTTPASEGDYMVSTPGITGNTAVGYVYAALMNPANATKTLVVKNLEVRVDAIAPAVVVDMNVTRITSASGGNLLPASQVPKKNTGLADTAAEFRYDGITVTNAVTERIIGITTPGSTGPSDGGELVGEKSLRFRTDTKLYLRPGEGIALEQEGTGNTGHSIHFEVEFESDVTASLWSSASSNRTLVHKNESIALGVFWQDNIGINNTTLQWNATTSGLDLNVSTNSTISGLTNWSNFTMGAPSDFLNVATGWKEWEQFANDTSGNLNNSSYRYFQLWGWANITNRTPFRTVADGYYLRLECRVLDKDNGTAVSGYNVSFYNNTTGLPSTVFLGSNLTNSTGSATVVWNTTGQPLGTYYPTCVLETANTTLFYNASESGQANTTVTLSRQLAIAASYNLSRGISFGLVFPPQTAINASHDNDSNATELAGITGAGNTSYYLNVSTTSTVNVTLCLSANDTLRIPGSSHTIPNSGYHWNATARHANGTWKGGQPGNPPGFVAPQTSANSIGTASYSTLGSSGGSSNVLTNITMVDAPDNATALFRFWLDVPSAQFAGDYYDNVTFKGVRDVDGCGSYP